MSIAELVYKKTLRLPENLQIQTLHFVDFLVTQNEATIWAKFSANQLGEQYVPGDAIYDDEPASS